MTENQSRRCLQTLLLVYLFGRILQLLAGRAPNLLIVVFHVLPAALFALLHGVRIYRQRGVLVFAGLSLIIGALSESISLRTGFPFGHYCFTGLMGPKISGLPILLALAYVGMGYLAWIVSLALIGGVGQPLAGKNTFLVPVVAGVLMTVWDLSMETVWADIDRGWVWRNGGPYFGVPVSNFLGWLLTTYVFYQLFAFYLQNHEMERARTSHWRLATAFFVFSAAGNLLVIAPASAGTFFMDATGKRWMISNILWTSRLVSTFLMLPLGLLAWLRLGEQGNLGKAAQP